MVRVFDIEIYRDGGSIEFRLEKAGKTTRIWLSAEGESGSRQLRLDDVCVSQGSGAAAQLVADLNEWHSSLPLKTREKIAEVQAKVGPYYDAPPDIVEAFALELAIQVRDHLAATLSE